MNLQTLPLIIGISGKLGSGKDTVGSYIETRAQADGYVCFRRAFGDALKEEVALFLSKQSFKDAYEFLEMHASADDFDDIMEQTFMVTPTGFWARLKAKFTRIYSYAPVHDFSDQYDDLLEAFNDRKRKEQFRRLLQWWGTEYRRKQCDESYWLDALQKWIEQVIELHPKVKLLIWIPDNRFPNEQHFLEGIGAYTIRVNRTVSTTPAITANHPSETSLDNYRNFSEIIDNNKIKLGTLRNISWDAFKSAVHHRRCIERPRKVVDVSAVGDAHATVEPIEG